MIPPIKNMKPSSAIALRIAQAALSYEEESVDFLKSVDKWMYPSWRTVRDVCNEVITIAMIDSPVKSRHDKTVRLFLELMQLRIND